MDDSLQHLFLRPSSPRQRQYEALRAVFVEKLSQKEAAARFGYSYGAFRQLMLQFRTAGGEGIAAPFLPRPVVQGPASESSRPPRQFPHNPPSPTPAP